MEMWLRHSGYPAEDLFRAADLPASPAADRTRIVSLHNYLRLMKQLADIEGPDFMCRVVSFAGLMEIGAPADAIRLSETVREGLIGAARVIHLQSSHLFFVVEPTAGGLLVTSSTPIGISDEQHHHVHQNIAMLVREMGSAASGRPLSIQVRLTPHPKFGVEHLIPYLGSDIAPSRSRRLALFIPDAELDQPFPWEPSPPTALIELARSGPVGRDSLTESAALLIDNMLDDGEPTIDRLARASGHSRRTLQRMLASEDTSFSKLLDMVRNLRALSQLNSLDASVSAVARQIGYGSPSSLTRAVRRWTGDTPRSVRQKAQVAT